MTAGALPRASVCAKVASKHEAKETGGNDGECE